MKSRVPLDFHGRACHGRCCGASRRRLSRVRRQPRSRCRRRQSSSALDAAYAQFKDLKEGANADYIPALAKVDPSIFGIALVTADGRVYTTGDVELRGARSSRSQGLHDGEGDRGAGSCRDREQHGRRCDRAGVQLDQRRQAVQGYGDERHGEVRAPSLARQAWFPAVRGDESGTRTSSRTPATSRDDSWA